MNQLQKSIARKVTQFGYGRYVAITKLIPKSWEYVKLTVEKQTAHSVYLKIEKLNVHAEKDEEEA